MKIGKLIRSLIKWAPVIYPVVRKITSKNKGVNKPISKK